MISYLILVAGRVEPPASPSSRLSLPSPLQSLHYLCSPYKIKLGSGREDKSMLGCGLQERKADMSGESLRDLIFNDYVWSACILFYFTA